MKLSYETLKDKITGCWNGKNIGGVLGAPLEGQRGVFDVSYYLQEDINGNPPPNDDLDLQLVWLAAAEQYGQAITPEILGEYWLTFITPHWNEYGRGKSNLAAGLQPPLSGHIENTYRNSCGAFIRSEIWACLCPGLPELAVRFAYNDAVIDHSEDGVYGELFCAAVESAAFVESDRDKLIEIGLSYIPEDCLVAKAVRLAVESYSEGLSWQEARQRMMETVPGTFGIQQNTDQNTEGFPTSPVGNDAPNNIGLMMIGWMYGEDDFAKSISIAVNCGEDTDCTAGTLAAILGIIHGNSGLPDKWLEPIRGVINTLCIEKSKAHLLDGIPGTVDQLAERVLRAIPRFLDSGGCELLEHGAYQVHAGEALLCKDRHQNSIPGIGMLTRTHDRDPIFHERFSPATIRKDHHLFRLYLEHPDGVWLERDRPLRLALTAEATAFSFQQWMQLSVYAPEAIQIQPGHQLSLPLQATLLSPSRVEFELSVNPEAFGTLPKGEVDLLIDVSLVGRHSYEVIKTKLFVR